MKMFWAYGERDVHATQIDQVRFKAKGMRSIYLLNPSFKKIKEDDVFQWDVTMKDVSEIIRIKLKKLQFFLLLLLLVKIKITEQFGSLYWCKIFKAPENTEERPHHIIGFEPLLTREK